MGLSTASSLLLAIFRLMGCVVAEGSLLILKPGEVAIWVIVKLEWVRRYDQLPERQSSADIIQSWDTACKEGGQNDYSVCSRPGYIGITNTTLWMWCGGGLTTPV